MSQRKLIQIFVTVVVTALLTLWGRVSVPTSNTSSALPRVGSATGTQYIVDRVVDGDTVVLNIENHNRTIRLIGLDTPEVVDPRKPVQCFGREASNKMHQILDGKTVRIETDPSQGALDKYNRTLAYLFLPDGTNVNKLMIEEGYGHEYTYRVPYKYQAEFKQAEIAARKAARGLWAAGVCDVK